MLICYHRGDRAGGPQELPELPQVIDGHPGRPRQPHGATEDGVEHPERDLPQPGGDIRNRATAQQRVIALGHRLKDDHLQTIPGVPRVKHL